MIVALGAACELARERIGDRGLHTGELRDRLESGIRNRIPNVGFNGDPAKRVPHIANISFGDVHGEGLLISLCLLYTSPSPRD